MLQSKARWKIKQVDEARVEALSRELNLSKIATRFLVQRGIVEAETARQFISNSNSVVHDPFLMKDMDKAVERIKLAIEKGERILIFGDYDADGVTSTSLLYLLLKKMGAIVAFYVPNRFTEGYGPNEEAFRQAKEEGVSLIITVDTGISAVHEANVAKGLGMDLIITDHHEVPPEIPNAYAVINPKQEDCPYPNKNLAGVGVAFKLAHALLGRFPEEYVDLVSIGTIADLVPLLDENRYLAAEGLKKIRQNERIGIKALLEECSVSAHEVNEEHIGFAVGPRLNAAGRLDSADPAIYLLITEDEMEARELAVLLDDLNSERKEIVDHIVEEAVEQVNDLDQLPPVIIVKNEGWNPGVIGIVASRLVERYYRPTIVLSIEEETGLAKGSARSIEGFDLYQALSLCRQWLPHFGGHSMAAGLTMKVEHIHLLHEKMNDIALETVREEDWYPSITVDLPISLKEVSIEAIYELNKMAPFGVGNPAPKVLIENVNINEIRKIGANGDHLKISFQEDDNVLEGVAFQMGNVHDGISPLAKISAIGHLSINEWNGHVKPQLIVEDLKVDEWQLFDWRGLQKPWENNSLQGEKVIAIIFREDTQNLLDTLPDEWEICVIKNNDTIENTINILNKTVLFLDLPTSFFQLKQLLHNGGTPNKIYAAFQVKKQYYFDMLPTRDHFKWMYAFLRKQKTFHLRKHIAELANYKCWPENSIYFICQVFFELDFVKINNGVITIVENPMKRDLTESKTYRERMEQIEIESKLFYSSIRELKDLFSSFMKGESKEEKVNLTP